MEKLEGGNLNAGAGMLGAFINQLEAAVNSGKLTPAQAAPLIGAAQRIVDSVEG